jgi:hypothetical protein
MPQIASLAWWVAPFKCRKFPVASSVFYIFSGTKNTDATKRAHLKNICFSISRNS